MISLSSLVLFGADASATTAFYQRIGVPLEVEDHGDGNAHHAGEIGGIHLAVYPAESDGRAPARRAGGSAFPGFYVDSLDEVAAALNAPVLQAHEQVDWGCRIVVEDPDGRPVEINQREHC